jgi:hypothetical protein
VQTTIYTLPEISMVGGATREIRFRLRTPQGLPYDADGAAADFSVCNFSNKNGFPLFSLTPEALPDENGLQSVLAVTLTSAVTVNLFGKYVYQLTVVDAFDRVEIPNFGLLYVSRNIHQTYLGGESQ